MQRPEPAAAFGAPWQAQIFGLVVQLGDRGVFTWAEWAEALGAAIREAQAAGDPDLGDTYYEHWIRALESLLGERGLADPALIAQLTETIEAEAHHVRETQLRT
ncbi:MAG: nitrile hydratase accessory protein [Proteobacteria bacterium]|nr:nitrile hydratase accessory protein [Pseudomonadota bacterium]